MEYIKKENGNVYLVIEHDVYGKNKTIRFLGKEYVEEKKVEKVEEKKVEKKVDKETKKEEK